MVTVTSDSIYTFLVTLLCILVSYIAVDWLLRRRLILDVSSKYILITGCDSGFGESACIALDSIGCNVIAACLTKSGMNKIKKKCSNRLRTIEMDVRDENSIQNALQNVLDIIPKETGLWGILNNVGISGELGPLEWFERSDVKDIFEVNVFGTLSIVRSFLPLMKRTGGGGRIINVSSILGRVSIPLAGPYSMSKHAVEAFSNALRIELNPYNIKVITIEPGGHKTPFLDKIGVSVYLSWRRIPESKREEYGREYLQQMIFLGTKLIPFLGSSDLDPVINAYKQALFSSWPRQRYIVGFDAKVLHLLSFLPSFISDAIFLLPGIRVVPMICKRRNKL